MKEKSNHFINIDTIKSIYLDSESLVKSKLICGDNIMCSFLEIAPNTVIPMHSHSEEQVLIILDGEIIHTIDNDTKKLTRGDVAIHPSNVLHGGKTGAKGMKGIDIFSPIRKDFLRKLEEN